MTAITYARYELLRTARNRRFMVFSLFASAFLSLPPVTRCWLLWSIEEGIRLTGRGIDAYTYHPREQRSIFSCIL